MTYPPQQDPYDPYGQSPQQSGVPYQQPYSAMPVSPHPHPVSPVPVSPYGHPAYAQPGFAQMLGNTAPPGDRPGVVTAAALSIIATVTLALFSGGLLFVADPGMSDEDKNVALVFGVVYLVIAVGFVFLALGVLRGRNGARITAIVMYSIFLAFNGCLGFTIVYAANETTDVPWQASASAVLMVALFLVDILVIVLLSVGATGRWFRAMGNARRAGILQ